MNNVVRFNGICCDEFVYIFYMMHHPPSTHTQIKSKKAQQKRRSVDRYIGRIPSNKYNIPSKEEVQKKKCFTIQLFKNQYKS